LSKELPVWNEDETDILPEFQLTYAHALIDNAGSVDSIVAHAGIQVLETRSFTGFELPRDPQHGFTFRKGADMYAIAGRDEMVTCIFGDRTLFLRPERWIKLSSKHTVSLVTQQANDEYFYRVFAKKKPIASAAREQGELRMIGNVTVRASYKDRLVAAVTANPAPPASVEQFLARDMELVVSEQGHVSMRSLVGNVVNTLLLTIRM
jgi:hypothetical protein